MESVTRSDSVRTDLNITGGEQTDTAEVQHVDNANRSFFQRLNSGVGGFDIIGRSRRWYSIAAAVVVVALAAMLIRGFSLGIDFEGGTRVTMPPSGASETAVEEIFTETVGHEPELVQIIGSGEGQVMEITSTRLGEEQINELRQALFDNFQPRDAAGEVSPDAIGDSTVSESWGSAITERMLIAMAVFLALVFAYIAITFERDMAITAIVSLIVDGIIIAGVYALIGFEVTPATVIGLLTVLAFSLYDTVVVFDKIQENTAGFEQSERKTYSELVNTSVNQTIMRSINTTVSTALPVIALMVIAVGLLGVGTLKDLALVQLIGIIQGTFSSIFLAAPFLVSLKKRQKKYREHDQKVLQSRREAEEAGVTVDASGNRETSDIRATPQSPQAPTQRSEPSQRPEPESGGSLTWRPGGMR